MGSTTQLRHRPAEVYEQREQQNQRKEHLAAPELLGLPHCEGRELLLLLLQAQLRCPLWFTNFAVLRHLRCTSMC
jgi:hypothetical protein